MDLAVGRRGTKRLWLLALAGSLALVAGTVAVVVSRLNPQPVRDSYSDSFHRSDRDIAGDHAPTGGRYEVQFDHAHTRLLIRGHRLVRGDPSHFGPDGAPILMVPNRHVPSTVAVRFTFTGNSMDGQNVVVGTCAQSFAASSIQLAVYPNHWTLFYTRKREPPDTTTDIVEIAKEEFAQQLATDASSVYTARMHVDLGESAVTVETPAGRRTITSPVISRYWGRLMAVQIRHQNPGPGDAAIVKIDERVRNG